MNPELIKVINKYSLGQDTSKNTIKIFLNRSISPKLYQEVKGEKIEDKVETVYNYLNDIVKEPEVKQVLNIVIADDTSSLDYVSYLKEKFDVIVHKTNDVKNPKDIDLVLFTGGEDVNPAYYDENIGKYTHINSNRDKKEIDTFYRFKGKSFLLGICRGNQLLTILSGGKLIQHVEGHCRDHSMVLNNGLKYNITSSHHQMLYPFDLNEKDYELIGYSEYFQSNTYLNGDNEEIELSNNFLEPEIVYYKKTNALCIQGHPEWNHCEKRTSQMCLNLIDKYLKEFKGVREKNDLGYYQTKSIIDTVPLDYDEEENYDYVEEEVYDEENELI